MSLVVIEDGDEDEYEDEDEEDQALSKEDDTNHGWLVITVK